MCRVAGKISRKKEQLAKLELSQKVKEDLKTVALGTSKINYLDPRITVAWCKRLEVWACMALHRCGWLVLHGGAGWRCLELPREKLV